MKKIVLMVMVFCVVGTFNSVYGQTYVDLGLSSETLWKDVNAEGLYTWDEAMKLFGDKMPTRLQWEELESECKWTWVKGKNPGYRVTGPNGNSIFLPAAGRRACFGGVDDVGSRGYYWSSKPNESDNAYDFDFDSRSVNVLWSYRCRGQSVRLVQD